jgi:hypothetical protein
MTYYTLHSAIISGSVTEKRAAISELRNRTSEMASRLLVLAAGDSSPSVVLGAVVVMMSHHIRDVQERYRETYIMLTDNEDLRIRLLAVRQLDKFADDSLKDTFRKVAGRITDADSLYACIALIDLGLCDEVRSQFIHRSANFVLKALKAITDKNCALRQDVITLDGLSGSLLKEGEEAISEDINILPGTTTAEFDELRALMLKSLDENERKTAFGNAVLEASRISRHLGRHLTNLGRSDKQGLRSLRHLRNSKSQAAEFLFCAAEHPDSLIHAAAMYLLADVVDNRTYDLAYNMLDDSNQYARSAAIEALGNQGDPRALPRLIEIACSEDCSDTGFSESLTALEAIVKLPVNQKDTLLFIYRGGNKLISPMAVNFLAKLRDETLISEFERILWDENEVAAIDALNGIAAIDTERCREIVKLRRFDGRPKVRKLARNWCEKAWGLEAPSQTEQLKAWPPVPK